MGNRMHAHSVALICKPKFQSVYTSPPRFWLSLPLGICSLNLSSCATQRGECDPPCCSSASRARYVCISIHPVSCCCRGLHTPCHSRELGAVFPFLNDVRSATIHRSATQGSLLSHRNRPPVLPEQHSASHAFAIGSPVLIACLPKQCQPQPHVVSCLKPTLLYNHPCSMYSYIAAQIGQKCAFACIL